MQRPVLVTGAYGFIGRYLCRALADAGRTVIGIGHGAWPREEWLRWGLVDWRLADVTVDTLFTYGGEPDTVFHCAGGASVSESVARPFQDFQRTVASTAAVLEYVRLQCPATRVVLVSSAGVYGTAGEGPIGEDARRDPISPYGVHKCMAEDLCRSLGRTARLQTVIVRLFSVYGAGLRKQLLWDACRKAASGEVEFFGTGAESRDWIHVRDAAALLMAAADRASTQAPVFNGGTGTGTSNAMILGRLFEAMACGLTPRFGGVARPGDPVSLVANPARALALGWRPQTDLRDGIEDYVRWYAGGAH